VRNEDVVNEDLRMLLRHARGDPGGELDRDSQVLRVTRFIRRMSEDGVGGIALWTKANIAQYDASEVLEAILQTYVTKECKERFTILGVRKITCQKDGTRRVEDPLVHEWLHRTVPANVVNVGAVVAQSTDPDETMVCNDPKGMHGTANQVPANVFSAVREAHEFVCVKVNRAKIALDGTLVLDDRNVALPRTFELRFYTDVDLPDSSKNPVTYVRAASISHFGGLYEDGRSAGHYTALIDSQPDANIMINDDVVKTLNAAASESYYGHTYVCIYRRSQ
jgi:hypothetical protein